MQSLELQIPFLPNKKTKEALESFNSLLFKNHSIFWSAYSNIYFTLNCIFVLEELL